MHGVLVEERSRARLPSIAPEGVPREPGPALSSGVAAAKSVTGKEVGNNHAHACRRMRADAYAVVAYAQLIAIGVEKLADPLPTLTQA
ncbi:hypothetical protein GCM10023220_29350 [Streptomyces ziwulingensis]|uniref:Transposase n=1 Tax=Streptomyces ziwulingensis TaxID=1045501 RepID=A0ABP9BU82_9ACTN